MHKHRILILGVVVLAFGACQKEEGPPPSEEATPTEPAATTPVDPATVGTITGKIVFEGGKPRLARLMMDQDPVCVEKHSGAVLAEDGAVNDNGTLPNVFVWVKTGAEPYAFPAPSEPVVLDQNGCVYKPHVIGIRVNQTLKIISSDPTTHNIHPMPRDNREWNVSQAPGAPPLEQKFSRPEVMIPVKCNQHPWMKAHIGVIRHPLFAVTGSEGTFTIKGMPPGDYTIGAWTATFGTQEQKVTIGAKESKTVDFAFKGA